MTLVLASNSASRQKILTHAGINFRAVGADVDEDTLKEKLQQEGCDHKEIAEQLALAKARDVSRDFPEDHVIGGDQLLVCDGRLFSKARNLEEARDNLKFFRGKTHQLITSLVIFRGNEEVWRITTIPELTMRNFSDEFLDDYLDRSGPDVLSSVGCYFYEGLGAQLFSHIEGDYFSILGLPLIQLMKELRQLGYLNT
ncbi:Maf family protein [Emcibacter nanhaiensis]|uniref:Nucleoside triphosphate pyrophosphatase n=1 Tax=Emcibacter nanhaiensis TaxID=1505037 RepID=A0A501PMW0_9PROT|nr:Maf family nucleotide pyrophosphatase [Emcibacter nanhaiensis]TPD61417.1 septum formation protein Maf [Emcibacter nanhaiensis]